jgi:hypothetical protein
MLITRASRSRELAQVWQALLRQEEQRLHVEVENLVPAALGKRVELGTPGGAGVVDEHVELAAEQLARALGDALDVGHLREVRSLGAHVEAALLRELGDQLVERTLLAPAREDARAALAQALADHAPQARSAARDEHAFAPHRKQLVAHGSLPWGRAGSHPRSLAD